MAGSRNWESPLTVAQVERLLDEVREAAAEKDREAAYQLECRLNRWALEAIAAGKVADPAAVAKAALMSTEVRAGLNCLQEGKERETINEPSRS